MTEYAFKDAKHYPIGDDYDIGRQLGTYAGAMFGCNEWVGRIVDLEKIAGWFWHGTERDS
jgi:hypothetical protein